MRPGERARQYRRLFGNLFSRSENVLVSFGGPQSISPRIVCDDFRHASEQTDFPRDANSFFAVIELWPAKLAPLASPDHDGKDLIWVWLVQVEERRLPFGQSRISCADDVAANRHRFTDVIFGFGCGELFLPLDWQNKNCGINRERSATAVLVWSRLRYNHLSWGFIRTCQPAFLRHLPL